MMGLKSLFKKITGVAPLLANAIMPGSGMALGLLGKAFGVHGSDADPALIEAAFDADPNALAKVKQIEAENEGELRLFIAAIDAKEIDRFYDLQELQAKSEDKFISRQRPTFGYIISYCFAGQLGGNILIAFAAVIADIFSTSVVFTDIMKGLVALNDATMPIWGIALTVQGYNIGKRSQDKVVASGKPAPGMMASLIGAIQKK